MQNFNHCFCFTVVIDQILNDYDNNQDGLISYYEYMQVRAKYQWKVQH